MAYIMEVKEIAPQPVATTRGMTQAEAGGAFIGEHLPAVGRYVREQGGTFTGPPFARYHAMRDGQFDLETGAPVVEAVAGAGPIHGGTLPGGLVASTIHTGPYDQLSAAHQALAAWIKEQGYTSAGVPWEVYWTDPGEEPDPAAWRTEVLWPIR